MNRKVNNSEHHETPAVERRQLFVGFTLALLLTLLAFGLVTYSDLSRSTILVSIAITGIVQLIVQFRYFLHIDFKKSHRDDLQLILFTGLLVTIMVSGTIWILYNQMNLMME